MKSYKASCLKSEFTNIKKLLFGRYVIRWNSVEQEGSDPVWVTYNETTIDKIPTYENIVKMLIRERYSEDDEFAIQRQRESKIEEWNQYYDYCENCKKIAREILEKE